VSLKRAINTLKKAEIFSRKEHQKFQICGLIPVDFWRFLPIFTVLFIVFPQIRPYFSVKLKIYRID
jgi:hypothetical protein